MDNSLYVLENNVILRITENHQVCANMAIEAPKDEHSPQCPDKILFQLGFLGPI